MGESESVCSSTNLESSLSSLNPFGSSNPVRLSSVHNFLSCFLVKWVARDDPILNALEDSKTRAF